MKLVPEGPAVGETVEAGDPGTTLPMGTDAAGLARHPQIDEAGGRRLLAARDADVAELLGAILTELQIISRHLAMITNERITEEDSER